MTKTYDKTREEYLEIDRMINEGLGGGDIYNSFDKKRYELTKLPSKKNKHNT